MLKRIVMLSIALTVTFILAQKLTIHNSDGSTYVRDLSLIDSITFSSDQSETGTVAFSIKGEDIPYEHLEFEGNLKAVSIEEAYMLIKNPTLHSSYESNSYHAGVALEGIWAIDLLLPSPDGIGTITDVEIGSYSNNPEITIPNVTNWAQVIDKGGYSTLKEHSSNICIKGTITPQVGQTYPFIFIVRLPTTKIEIEEYPTDENMALGQKLILKKGQTLPADFHSHIDHPFEILDENPIDLSQLDKTGNIIIISDTQNNVVTDKLGNSINLYSDMIQHLIRGDHWDVNIIPEW